jgi:hypothetical protein
MSSKVHYHQIDSKLHAYDLLEMVILKLALIILDDEHHLMSSYHGVYVNSLLMHTHGKIPNPTYTTQTQICNGLVHKA